MKLRHLIVVMNEATGDTRRFEVVPSVLSAFSEPSDTHYALNLYLPNGLYRMTVILGNQTAVFQDVEVTVGMPMTSQVPQLRANDGRTLAGEPAGVQAMFTALWGSQAGPEWVREHNLALGGGR